jgi:hypothetical protein
MITDILNLSPEFGLTEKISFRTDISESEDGTEHRVARWDNPLRTYQLTCKYLTKADMDLIWDFYIARKGQYDFFLVKVLTEYQKENESLGNANNSTTQFLLHNYPVDTAANYSCTVNGVADLNITLSNDDANEKSYINFSSAYESGEILVSYDYYFKVRFGEDELTRELVAYQLLNTGMILKEVRFNTYAPINGNSSSSSSSMSSSSSSSTG